MKVGALAEDWLVYWDILVSDAHQLLAWGYTDVRSALVKAKDEYEMTGLLAKGMNERIDSPNTPDRYLQYAVHNEKPISPSGELGKDRPKLDLQLEHCGRRPRQRFTFEAKRLRDDATVTAAKSVRDYVGVEGLRRYVEAKYAAESVRAAMLGCIQAHDPDFWSSRVQSELNSEPLGGPKYALTASPQSVSVNSAFSAECISSHARDKLAPIDVYHVLIDCQ